VSKGPVLEVKGARELRRTLARAGHDLGDLQTANAAISTYVATASKTAAPRVSGRLAGSVRGNKAKASAVVRAGSAGVPYAGPIHWGWPARNIAPQPFLVETAHKTEPQWRLMYLTAIDTVLGKVKGT